ncbi:hypothetical protein IKP85_00400 [bacterium]|nr:hypothetical protein [bacterium]
MDVKRISYSPEFTAKTTVIAPENLVSKQEVKSLVKLGSQIGEKTDSIKISISGLLPSKRNPKIKGYDVKATFTLNKSKKNTFSGEGIDINKISPFEYAKKILTRIKDSSKK